MARLPPIPSEINLSFRHDLPLQTGGRQGYSVIAPPEHCDFALRTIDELLNITPAVLGRLVGKGQVNVYSWFKGHTPSQAYWVRIAYLLALVHKGVNLRRVRTIDWSQVPFRIEWWPGAEQPNVDDFGNRMRRTATEASTLRETWMNDMPVPERPAQDEG
jgi:hypothetical protein